MPIAGPTPPNIDDLVLATLQDLGVQATGQPVAAEDANLVLARVVPKLEELNARDVASLDINNLSHAELLSLAKILAWELAPAFSITDAAKLAMLQNAGAPNGTAEQCLKDVVRLRTPRQTLRVERFSGYRTYGGWSQ